MMLIVHIPSEGNGGKPRRALAGMQHFKKLAFPTISGKFVPTPITLVGITGPTVEPLAMRVKQELDRHVMKSHIGAGLNNGRFDYCDYCSGHPQFPCPTVRTLTGVSDDAAV